MRLLFSPVGGFEFHRVSYRIAAFVLGLIVGGYWLRVMRMARKARQKTGRAANLVPAETTGRLLRLLWTPVVLVWIGQPLVTAFGLSRPALLKPLVASSWLAWAMVAVAAGAFWLTRICWKTMGRNWRMGIDPNERTQLVLSGPYRYVRHPIYALSQVMMLATALAVPSPILLGAACAHVLLMQWEARREEAYLVRTHGESYATYSATIGRFFPLKFGKDI